MDRNDLSRLIFRAECRSSSELVKHTDGPGKRFVFSDQNNPCGSIYAMTRRVENVDNPEQHIEDHLHDVESFWMFMGSGPNAEGLRLEIKIGDEKFIVESPFSVTIPAGINHNFRFISGSGTYTNIVLIKSGNYNDVTK